MSEKSKELIDLLIKNKENELATLKFIHTEVEALISHVILDIKQLNQLLREERK